VPGPRHDVDLLAPLLAGVAEPQRPSLAAAREPPRLPDPVRPDLAAYAVPRRGPRVVRGDRVRRARVHVEAEDLPLQLANVLAEVGGVVRVSRLAEAHVELPVGHEGEPA